jgi:3-deoxy-manno-octulosonate cytidylyltransferase (CMP-KDO synthetase)
MNTVIIIPARYKSTRFAGKPLIKLHNKPMIQWVAELSASVVGKEKVYIATEDKKIQAAVIQMGYNVVMTSENCLTGTDRVAEVAKKIEADIYVNVQGDEPLVDPKDIQKVIDLKKQYPSDVINSYTMMKKDEDPQSLNKPKIIFTEDKRLVYISRQPLPGFKDQKYTSKVYYKQVCIYAFNREELITFRNFGRKSKLEECEDIEIIRFLEWGKTIRLVETQSGSISLDVPQDVEKVEAALKEKFGE